MTTGGLLDLYPNRGLRLVRGDGAYLEAADGRRYLDLGTNYGVSIFGYRHPSITAALTAQLEMLPTLHGSFSSDVRVKASLALGRRLPMESPAICWSNSGTEAVEAALKFASLATGKKRFVAFRGAYHGKTLGSLSATDSAKYRGPFEPLPWDVARVEFSDAAALRSAIDDRTAGVILEPIQGESGIIVPPDGYLSAVRRATLDAGVLLIVDEIQTGCGRTGRFLACEREQVSPDIVCLGKGLAGGIPVGATAVTPAIAERVPRGIHTSTFGGNPLACAGALAVLALLTPEQLCANETAGAAFLERLRARVGGSCAVRGVALMAGVVAGARRDEVLKGLQRRGVIAIPAGLDVVRFLPPFVAAAEDLDRAADLLAETLAEVA
jgi:LysW-gamma-L-lysine/LysW-L-ornithine aminotransferase